MRSTILFLLAAFMLTGGCPMETPEEAMSEQTAGSPFSNPVPLLPPPFSIDGEWYLDYTDSPNPTCLTFFGGRIVAELGGCFNPVEITASSVASVVGSSVSFSYSSRQSVATPSGFLFFEGTTYLNGVLQFDGSISGTTTTVGLLNGVPFENTELFFMSRI